MSRPLSADKKALLAYINDYPGRDTARILEDVLKSAHNDPAAARSLHSLSHRGYAETDRSGATDRMARWRITDKGRRAAGIPPLETALQAPAPAPIPAPAPAREASPSPSVAMPASWLHALDALAEGLARHIIARVRSELALGLRAMTPPEPAPEVLVEPTPVVEAPATDAPAPRAAEPQAPRKRVMIVGLLPGQQNTITREFGRELDLRFITSDAQASNRASELSRRSDAAVLMTKFVSHTAENIIRAGGGRLIRVSGGMSQLRDALTRLYCEENVPA